MKIYTAIFRHSTEPDTIIAANKKDASEIAKYLADEYDDKLACVIERTPNMAGDLYDQMVATIHTLPPTDAARAFKLLADEWYAKHKDEVTHE